MSAKLVPVRYFRLLRGPVEKAGVAFDQVLQGAGIDPERFDRPTETLNPLEVEAFVATLRRLTQRSDWGFEMGSQIKVNSHDILGYGMLSCRNVHEYLAMAARYYHLMTETFTLRYHRGAGVGEAIYTPTMSMPFETLCFYCECLAMAHCNQIRMLLGPSCPAFDFYLSIPQPVHMARYAALAPVRFHFDEQGLPGVRVVMGSDVLDHALPWADPVVVRQVEEQCAAMGQTHKPAESRWGDYVLAMLRQSSSGPPTLQELAHRLKVSPRTLDRYLQRENLQFRQLYQQVLIERACELLGKPGVTVAQVAVQLGFTESANFSRAFKRVVGVSPSEYQMQASAPSGTNAKPGL